MYLHYALPEVTILAMMFSKEFSANRDRGVELKREPCVEGNRTPLIPYGSIIRIHMLGPIRVVHIMDRRKATGPLVRRRIYTSKISLRAIINLGELEAGLDVGIPLLAMKVVPLKHGKESPLPLMVLGNSQTNVVLGYVVKKCRVC